MPVTMKPKKRRKATYWYHLPPERWPWCPTCRVICNVGTTEQTELPSVRVQRRYCPKCGKAVKTTLRDSQ